MRIVPLTTRQANYLVKSWHRHNTPLKSLMSYAVGLESDGCIVAAAICGRPISPSDADGFTLEVKRLVSDGTANACSMLYGACVRAAKALGYCKLITFTLPEEGGHSLKASGWTQTKLTNGKQLHTNYATGERTQTQGPQRVRWEITMSAPPSKIPYEFDADGGKSKSAPLPFPPRGVSETSDTPGLQLGKTGAIPETPHEDYPMSNRE
jgi:hypothetical protein